MPIFVRMKLSVIIPVYLTERTLGRCVESVLGQNCHDLEVILVDDESPDSSPKLCDAYAEKHSCVRVLHLKHGGLSAARNAGIAVSQGQYVTFVDSDDAISPNTYAALLDILAKNPAYDILEYPCTRVMPNRRRLPRAQLRPQVYTDMRAYWLTGKAYQHAYACNKIYRRALFDKVRYPEGQVFEDLPTLLNLLNHGQTVAICDAGEYLYHYNKEGITAQAGPEELLFQLNAHNQALPAMHDKAYYAQVINIALDYYHASGKVPTVVDLPYWNTPKLLVKRLFGLKTLCILHSILRNLR